MVQTNCVRDRSGYRPAPNALCAYERMARPLLSAERPNCLNLDFPDFLIAMI